LGELKFGRLRLRTPAVCGCVIGKNLNEMREGISRAVKQGADLVELRIDDLRGKIAWEELIQKDLPTLLANHPEREGGYFRDGEEDRVKLILEGIERGVSCVDIELSTPKKLREQVVSEAKKSGVTVLMSHHDVSETPPLESLMKLTKDSKEAGCDIAKIVTFAKSPSDALRMLDFLVQMQGKVTVPIVAFAMGGSGRITRFVAPIFGSPIIYATAWRKTGPGQLDVATMKQWTHELMSKEVRD
jgi:3-dehydroquinate dehydratase-1